MYTFFVYNNKNIIQEFCSQMESMDMLDWDNAGGTTGNYGAGAGNMSGGVGGSSGGESMMVDEDYMELMTDTLFSTISSNQPMYFPDSREIGNSLKCVNS